MIALPRRTVSRARVLGPALLVAACADAAGPTPDTSAALVLAGSGFSQPVFVTAPPGDTSRLFVVEQTGLIRILAGGSVLAEPFLDLSDSIAQVGGEQGLLGLAFHPGYAVNGFFYVNYTDLRGDTRVVRFHAAPSANVADTASAVLILHVAQPFTNHNGGMIAFGPDTYLYIGMGDGGSGGDPQGHGQNRASLLGKLLRLDVDGGSPYAIPPTNPFIGLSSTRNEIWALGLRNPWRFSFDRATGAMYLADVGQGAIEEIDYEPAGTGGRNYGWVIMEGTDCYVAGCTPPPGLTPPVHQYTHADGCSVTGGYVYRGTRAPSLAGIYFYSDYCDGWVRSFRIENGVAVDHREWPTLRTGGNISSYGEDGRGELYIVTHSLGFVHRIVAATP